MPEPCRDECTKWHVLCQINTLMYASRDRRFDCKERLELPDKSNESTHEQQ